jgi:hypothetical protein
MPYSSVKTALDIPGAQTARWPTTTAHGAQAPTPRPPGPVRHDLGAAAPSPSPRRGPAPAARGVRADRRWSHDRPGHPGPRGPQRTDGVRGDGAAHSCGESPGHRAPRPRAPSPAGGTNSGRKVVSRRFCERRMWVMANAAVWTGMARQPTTTAATSMRRARCHAVQLPSAGCGGAAQACRDPRGRGSHPGHRWEIFMERATGWLCGVSGPGGSSGTSHAAGVADQ